MSLQGIKKIIKPHWTAGTVFNIQLLLAGAQGGYSITWSSFSSISFDDGGSGYVIMNYYDGTSAVYNNAAKIRSLEGNTYEGVVSIKLNVEIPKGNHVYSGEIISDDVGNHVYVGMTCNASGYSLGYGYGTITLGEDLRITNLYMMTLD